MIERTRVTIEETDVSDFTSDKHNGMGDNVRLYLREIGHIPLLTARDEKIAARRDKWPDAFQE